MSVKSCAAKLASSRMSFPRLYAIVDMELLSTRRLKLATFAKELREAGVECIQYRNKQGSDQTMLQDAAILRGIFPANGKARFLLNDRADLALLAGLDGVHVGQEDLAPEDARIIVGESAWVGVSTHVPQQVIEADKTSCDYVAFGPIFATASKLNPDPEVGLTGLKAARSLTSKPLVAIGGITRENVNAVMDAGADSVAVISGLLPQIGDCHPQQAQQIAEEFLELAKQF